MFENNEPQIRLCIQITPAALSNIKLVLPAKMTCAEFIHHLNIAHPNICPDLVEKICNKQVVLMMGDSIFPSHDNIMTIAEFFQVTPKILSNADIADVRNYSSVFLLASTLASEDTIKSINEYGLQLKKQNEYPDVSQRMAELAELAEREANNKQKNNANNSYYCTHNIHLTSWRDSAIQNAQPTEGLSTICDEENKKQDPYIPIPAPFAIPFLGLSGVFKTIAAPSKPTNNFVWLNQQQSPSLLSPEEKILERELLVLLRKSQSQDNEEELADLEYEEKKQQRRFSQTGVRAKDLNDDEIRSAHNKKLLKALRDSSKAQIESLLKSAPAQWRLNHFDGSLKHKEKLLGLAASNGKLEDVKILVEEMGVAVTHKGNRKIPLHCAAKNGHSHVVEYLITKCPENIDKRDGYGVTSLFSAVEEEHSKVVQLLVDNGANIFVKVYHKNKHTPYSKAKEIGNQKIIDIFMSALKKEQKQDSADLSEEFQEKSSKRKRAGAYKRKRKYNAVLFPSVSEADTPSNNNKEKIGEHDPNEKTLLENETVVEALEKETQEPVVKKTRFR